MSESADRFMDAETGDFVDGLRGTWKLDTTLRTQILLSVTIELGSWEGDPTLGHRFNELARATDSAETRQRAGDLARAALKWLVDAGELERVDVTVESHGAGVLAFEADCYPPVGDPISVGPFFLGVGR